MSVHTLLVVGALGLGACAHRTPPEPPPVVEAPAAEPAPESSEPPEEAHEVVVIVQSPRPALALKPTIVRSWVPDDHPYLAALLDDYTSLLAQPDGETAAPEADQAEDVAEEEHTAFPPAMAVTVEDYALMLTQKEQTLFLMRHRVEEIFLEGLEDEIGAPALFVLGNAHLAFADLAFVLQPDPTMDPVEQQWFADMVEHDLFPRLRLVDEDALTLLRAAAENAPPGAPWTERAREQITTIVDSLDVPPVEARGPVTTERQP